MSEHDPAIVPDPVEPAPLTYRVLGQHAFLGHAPGETFTAALDPAQEQRALARGSIELAVPEWTDFSREQLLALAEEMGVENPKRLRSKPALLDAINEARKGANSSSTQEG